MKKISADYIFPGNSVPIKHGVVVINDIGEVLSVLNPEIEEINWDEVEQHEGIICPGFVNTHCHLELSYLKGVVAENTQLHGFVQELMTKRDDACIEDRLEAIVQAEKEMIANGIVAIGDIANGASTFNQKKKSNLKYHTFIEVFGLDPEQAESYFERAVELKKEYYIQEHVSITAHAPYSMSRKLVELVNLEKDELLTIHNQETDSENELFKSSSGNLFNQLTQFSDAIKNWKPTGKSSLISYFPKYSNTKRVLLVHNTFTNKEDIEFAKNYSSNVYWCFCPNANEYIEGKQPNYHLFLNEKCTIGTDSLASNWSLSILDELKTISKKEPNISLQLLIKWATFNGAKFLGFNDLGAIEKGKSPGLNLISGIRNEQITEHSSIKKII